jgi:hypothetical protein
MTRNAIIEKLFTGKNFTDCINKMEPDHLREDLRQEIILIVCEWPNDKIIKLHADGALDFYVVKVILNQIKSNSSPFAKKYRQQFSEYNEKLVESEREVRNTGNDISATEANYLNKRHLHAYTAMEDLDFEERELRELIEDLALEEVDKQYWYNKGLINLYMKHGTYRAVQEETGIPHVSIYKTIQKSFKEIKSKVSK